MSDIASDCFFITIEKKKNRVRSFKMNFKKPTDKDEAKRPVASKVVDTQPYSEIDFNRVISDFEKAMEIYFKIIPFLISTGPQTLTFEAASRIEKFAIDNGLPVEELCSESHTVYKIENSFMPLYRKRFSSFQTAYQSLEHIPQVMVIGLVSSYDFYTSQLLRVIFTKCPNIIFTSQKNITFSDLIGFNSIENAKNSIIDREIEAIIRESHHQQFVELEKMFGIPLRKGLDSWPEFIEICERRNLFTHTGGFVSSQYLKNCRDQKIEIDQVEIGQLLDVKPTYFKKAVSVFYEVGIKLCYVAWRKFDSENADKADERILLICSRLIKQRRYEVAISILNFTSVELQKRKGNERTRRLMIINLALANNLLGDEPESYKILDAEDWRGSEDLLQMHVSAIKGDVNTTIQHLSNLKKLSKIDDDFVGSASVFKKLREVDDFKKAFADIFSEPLRQAEIRSVSETEVDIKGIEGDTPL